MPEAATGRSVKPGWAARESAVVAAHPAAAEAGQRILDAGGNAIDAAVAVQMVLALVEPQSSGLGGGGFLIWWTGHEVEAWDGREVAPVAADERLLLDAAGRPLPFARAKVGGRAVGVPGAVRMLEAVHRRHGQLPWARLFDPAIELADSGFEVGPRLHRLLQAESALRRDAGAARYFYDESGRPWPVGHRLRNPALAAVLRLVARDGSRALHEGPVAEDIVRRVRGHPDNPGRLGLDDLREYRAVQRAAMCTDWLHRWRICGMPPPSSGHVAVMQILGLLEQRQALGSGWGPDGPGVDWLDVYVQAAKLAFADRAQYLADPAFVDPPAGRWDSLLDRPYLRQRAALIGSLRQGAATAGSPGGLPPRAAAQAWQPESGTSHFGIVDRAGRVLAMTTTIEDIWGSRILSDGGTGLPGGFLLNNQLTDFSFRPRDEQGRPVANRAQAGKRPRSSMSPTLVFDKIDGRPVLSLGSAGGAAIIPFTARTLLATLVWGLDAQRAVDLPHVANFNGPTVVETGGLPAGTLRALRERGHVVVEQDLNSGLHVLQRTPEGWFGAADPRREGEMRGR